MAAPPGREGTGSLPPEFTELLSARDEAAAARARDAFLSSYGDLILRAARSVNCDHDAAMDGYTHVPERLRADDFARLRKFTGGDRDDNSREQLESRGFEGPEP